jgi:hypothetical protein
MSHRPSHEDDGEPSVACPTSPAQSSGSRQRGAALLEALIAFAVTAVASAAMITGQAALHRGAELARLRGEATRLAAGVVEHWRSQPLDLLETLLRRHAPVDDEAAAPAPYALFTQARLSEDESHIELGVQARWVGRDGVAQRVALDTVVGAVDPALAGLLTLPPHGRAGRAPLGRHAGVPTAARPLGDGTSLFTPPGAGGAVAWRFSDATGEMVQQCAVAIDGSPVDCRDAAGAVVHGLVRFDTDGRTSAAEAEQPTGSPALSLDMALHLETPGSAACLDDAPPSASPRVHLVHYACLVTSSEPWSGRLVVAPQGWHIGSTPETYRVCRYSAERDGRPGIANAEHPRDYSAVQGSLHHQHFLVVRGDSHCPADVPADPARADLVDSSTVELAPRALP